MVFTLPPVQMDNINKKNPDLSLVQNNEVEKKKDEEDPLEVFKFKDIFHLPLTIILQNVANSVLLIIDDLFEPDNYKSPKEFLKIFLIENRLVYLGLFVIFLSIFMALFFRDLGERSPQN